MRYARTPRPKPPPWRSMQLIGFAKRRAAAQRAATRITQRVDADRQADYDYRIAFWMNAWNWQEVVGEG